MIMKRTTKRYLVDEDTYNGFKNEPKIHHPDMVATLKNRQDMHDILKNPAMNDYDKVTHHATKVLQYLNNLQLALTRSKSAAVLGTPFGTVAPDCDSVREINAPAESDDEDMDVTVGQVQQTPTSTFHTPMATTPSAGPQSLTPPDTPMNTSTGRPRRRATKSPTATSTTEQPTFSNNTKTSTAKTTEKRTVAPRPNKKSSVGLVS